MPTPIRFHLDEQIQGAIARGLRRRGIDVTTTADAGLAGAPDEDHLTFARAENRVLVTDDRDFLRMQSSFPTHAGIAVCNRRRRTIGQIVRGLTRLFEQRSSEDMRGRVEYL